MNTREEYDSKWTNYQSGPPAVDPRQPHHTANRRWPRFELLCDRAQHQHVKVMLDVTQELTVKDEGREQRDPRRIRLMVDDKDIASQPVRDGDIDAAATMLLQTLAV